MINGNLHRRCITKVKGEKTINFPISNIISCNLVPLQYNATEVTITCCITGFWKTNCYYHNNGYDFQVPVCKVRIQKNGPAKVKS